jgi:hypothetical protein
MTKRQYVLALGLQLKELSEQYQRRLTAQLKAFQSPEKQLLQALRA